MSLVRRAFHDSCLVLRLLFNMKVRSHPHTISAGCITRSVFKKYVVDIASPNAIPQAANLLESGEVIALPTDTVYGLACSANDPEAIKKLYDIKGRICTKPVAICVPEIRDVLHWGNAAHLPMDLLEELLPGAVTIVVYKSHHLDNPYLNPGVDKIGIRVPKFDFIRNVTKQFKAPMALTSANLSSQQSTLNVKEFQILWPRLGAVFDGGQLGLSEEQRAASTVIDLSEPGEFEIIRKGVAIKRTIELLKRYRFKETRKTA
uniref:Threonylcarbamoyl-AMP synthase n=1 Tax=Culex tarsalis TaxID=7177 RepID=A0A1Q3F4A0_CULTA